MKTNILTLLIMFFAACSYAQNMRLAFDFGNRLTFSNYDELSGQKLYNPFDSINRNGNNDFSFRGFSSRNYQFGATITVATKKKRAFELGISHGNCTAIANMDSFGFGDDFGSVTTAFHQLEIPIRFKYPIYLLAKPKKFKRDSKKNKSPKFITGSIGLSTTFINKDFMKSGKRGRIDDVRSDGTIRYLQYELRPALHKNIGFGVEIGFGYFFPIRKNLDFIISTRATLGLKPIAAYEFAYLKDLGGGTGSGVIQVKNDNLSLNIGLSYAF